MSDIGNFNRSWSKSVSTLMKDLSGTVRDSAEELLSDIVKSTPTNTGQLRGNWQVSLGSPEDGSLIGVTDMSGLNTISKGRDVLKPFILGDTGTRSIYFANNLDYAENIEYGHHSKQAPYGMVRINTIRFDSIVKKNFK